jgi:hypothetical protein
MPRMRCIDNNGYELTEGYIYNVFGIDEVTDYIGDRFCHVIDDSGEDAHLFYRRFEPVEEGVEMPIQEQSTEEFAIGDIVKISEHAPYYQGQVGYITSIGMGGRYKTSIASYFYSANELSKVNEAEILNPVLETEEPNEYIHTPANMPLVKAGIKAKIPTRKSTTGSTLADSNAVKIAMEHNQDFIYVRSVASSGQLCYVYSNADYTEGHSSFYKQDLEILPTNFVQGAIENGHRIKDECGKTHTFEAYDTNNTNQSLIKDTDDYIDYIDSTGWFIRLWKALVTKPRGTLEYTEYMAMCPTCYETYKAQTALRMEYLRKEITNSAIRERNRVKENNKSSYLEVKRQAELFMVRERERIEREAREAEERRQIEELTKHGIWKHHVWN